MYSPTNDPPPLLDETDQVGDPGQHLYNSIHDFKPVHFVIVAAVVIVSTLELVGTWYRKMPSVPGLAPVNGLPPGTHLFLHHPETSFHLLPPILDTVDGIKRDTDLCLLW